MKRLLVTFLLGFALAGALFGALSHHFILTDRNLVIERKGELGLEDTFVDARHWGLGDYLKHPRVAAVLMRHGIRSAFDSSDAKKALDDLRRDAAGALDKLKGK